MGGPGEKEGREALQCVFCSKSRREGLRLIGGQGVYICEDCVRNSNALLSRLTEEEERRTQRDPAETLGNQDRPGRLRRRAGNGQAHPLRGRLQPLPPHRPGGKNSSGEVELQKSNVLFIGPTGTGKTLMASNPRAHCLHVPFAIADATTLTEAGYVGEDVENIILRLLQNADYDVKRAERGIIYIDEIDKISRKIRQRVHHPRRLGEGVQQAC
jgi:ATP-dependent Clp protease ATP-binding subunit ClpX